MILYAGLPIPIPADVAICPACERELHLHVTEWTEPDMVATQTGCEWDCAPLDADRYEACPAIRNLTYGASLATARAVYRWARRNVRVAKGYGEPPQPVESAYVN